MLLKRKFYGHHMSCSYAYDVNKNLLSMLAGDWSCGFYEPTARHPKRSGFKMGFYN